MDEVFKMYAMSDGSPVGEPDEIDPDLADDLEDDEEDEGETAGILTSSDDDEVVGEETIML